MLRIQMVVLGAALLAAGCSGKDGDNGGADGNAPNASARAAWQTFAADDGSYTLEMPKEPTPAQQSASVPQGTIEIHMQELVTADVNYAAGYTVYPPGFLDAMGPDAQTILAKAQDATVRQRNGDVVEANAGTLGGHPSRSMTMRFKMPEEGVEATLRQTAVLANGRMYLVQTLHSVGASDQAARNAERFHSSFTLKAN